jgi:cytochrome c biogenesis protein CcmG/thiol:disulfide interchange protein DsbE
VTSYPARYKITLSLIILALGVGWIWFSRTPLSSGSVDLLHAPQAGFSPPDFSLACLTGEEFKLSDMTGKPLVINFWASWCPPCRAEMPALNQISQEYGNSGLVVAAVNATSQDSLNDVSAFVSTYQLTFPIPLDSAGSAARDYNVHSLPTTFFITAEGVVNKVIIGGPLPVSMLRIEINRLLQEKR